MATTKQEPTEWLREILARQAVEMGPHGAVLAGAVMVAAFYDMRFAATLLVAGLVWARGRQNVPRRTPFAAPGSSGELETARTLALLPAGFTVVTDVPLPSASTPTVVVGPTGVWVVDTASYGGLVEESPSRVMIGGRPIAPDPRQASRSSAVAVADLLRHGTGKQWPVEALLCLPNATLVNGNAREACVVGTGQLLTRIRLARGQVGADERRRIVAALRRPQAEVEAAPIAPRVRRAR